MEISIPPVREMRTHIIIAVNFLVCYLSMLEANLLSGEEPPFLDRDSLKAITLKLDAAHPDAKVVVSPQEVKLIYAAYLLSSRLLVTDKGEAIADMILKELPEDHDFKQFEAFRHYMLQYNEALISDTEENLAENIEGFEEWKTVVGNWEVE